MRKLFYLFVALFATINLWSYDFQYGDLYYKFGNAEGIEIPDTIGWNIPAECLTVAQAREICAALENGATTGTKYYVKGWVKKLSTKHEDSVKDFNNAIFFIEDVKGANSQEDFEAYQVYGPNGSKITTLDQILVGDYVVLYGELTNYNGTYETTGKGTAHIWKSSNPALGGNSNTGNLPTDVVGAGTFENPYTANDVLLLNNSKTGYYWVKAHIVGQVSSYSLSGSSEFDAPFTSSTDQNGEQTGYMLNLLIADAADESNPSNCVPVQLPSGAVRTGLNLVQNPNNDSQVVLLYGSLEKYFSVAGVKATQYAKVGDKEFGINPNVEQKEPTTAFLNQVRVTQIAVVVENESSNITKQNIFFNDHQEHYVIVTNQTNDVTNYNTLTEVEIPETVEYNGITYIVSGIDDYAFAYAENLQSVTIPKNIKAIGNCTFANCYNLQTITFESEEPPHIFYKTFDNMHYDVQVYVPCGAVSAYQSAGIYYAQEFPAEYDIYILNKPGSGGLAGVDYNTICGAQISANPDFGYYFVQWSDGNTDNPRVIELTQDTILTAEFVQIISGRCGDNLYWSYNESDQSISITGSGDMYNYTSKTQPWWLFKEEIKMVTTSNTATSIGESAFAGAIRLADVYLGSNIETIAENAFAECNRLYHIYCYPTYPPFAKQTSFANYNIYLHVPCEYKEEYDLDVVFGNFKYIECLGAETDNTSTDTVISNASSTHVTITWPTEENANTYTIVIKNGDIVFCTLTFNANGQLLNIAFAPAKNGSNRTAQYATQTTNGLRFTVTGLNEGTHYTYDITAKNNEGDTIQTHTGAFTTKSNASTEVDNINAQTSATQKLFHNNQLLILRDGKTYNVMGQEL